MKKELLCVILAAITAAFVLAQNRAGGAEDLDRQSADISEALRLNPNFAEAYNNRGDAYYN
jgi:hypothetical protein